MLGMLTFASPLWALGLFAAIGVPVLAHLLSRARYREVLFPATRLVRQAVVATTRIERPRHLLLLLLRLLALLAIVAAFMQPRWTPEAAAIDPDRGVSLVMLIDASASMQRVEGGASLYQRAIREAGTLIRGLDPTKDVASVILVNRLPASLLPEPTAQLDVLADRLGKTEATFETADWASAVTAAGRLADTSSRQMRIVVLSDQQGDWPVEGLESGPLWDARIDHIRLDAPSDNTAVRLIDLKPYPPVAERPLTATIELAHFGGEPRKAKLTAVLGPNKIERQLSLPPRSTQRVELTLPGVESGKHLLRVSIEGGDAMPWDNQSGAVLDVQAGPRVLVVYDDKTKRDVAKRIGLMLRPGDEAASSEALPRIEYASVDEAVSVLAQAEPSDLRTVVSFANEAVGSRLYPRLKAYAQRGGGVLLFGLPVSQPPEPRRATNIDFSLEPLRVFEGPARAGLASLTWPKRGGMHESISEDQTTALLYDEDAHVLVTEKLLGRGRIIYLHTVMDAGPGGLPAEPAFVVLFNELCRYASPGASMPSPTMPGDLLPAVLRSATRFSSPDDALPGSDRVTAPGAYLLAGSNGLLGGGTVAELDAQESDTTDNVDWSQFAGVHTSAQPAGAADLSAGIRPEPIELWPYLLVGMLLLAAAESSLLWRFAHKPGGEA